MFLQRAVILAGIPAVVAAALASGGEAIPRGERAILFTGTEEQIIDYLKSHHVPTIYGGRPGGPMPDPQEAERALVLFKTGSARLRLAIAASLFSCEGGPRAMEFWRTSTDQDYEARHWLVGIALYNADKEEKKMLLEWLLREAHPSYAGPLLSSLSAYSLYRDLDPQQQDAFIPLLEQLWRQPGEVIRIREGSLPGTRGGIQECTVALIPLSIGGRDLLLRWLINYGKKVDEKTLDEMWERWRLFAESQALVDRSFAAEAAGRMELAESWLLGGRRNELCDHAEIQARFMDLVREQVLNPDERVRLRAIEYVLYDSKKLSQNP